MMYRECPHCGAHLDSGEICDCRDKERDRPDAAGTASQEIIPLAVYQPEQEKSSRSGGNNNTYKGSCHMKIKSLRLENFQGIASASFDFDGRSAAIYGDNATGKTTVFNAVAWLLFDKPGTGAKNFTPKTKGADGDLHNLDHSAEAEFILPSGEIASFRKVYHEVWKKKRGSATAEFNGHTIDYYIDGVPAKEKAYTSTLENCCGGIERMKLLTMPDYFAEVIPWDERRKILLELCGDVTDEDVIRSDEALAELETYLRKPGTGNRFYSVEEYRKIASAGKSEINKQLQAIPGRIDEASRAIPDGSVSAAELDVGISARTAEREGLLQKRAALLTGDTALAEARKKTIEAEAALASAKSAYSAKVNEANAHTMEKLASLTMELGRLRARAAEERSKAKQLSADAQRMTDARNRLLVEYAEVQAESWDDAKETCPTCGQRLPADKVEDMKAEFNRRRSERLTEINRRGKETCGKDAIAEAQRKADEAEREAAAAESEAAQLQASVDGLRENMKQFPAFETTPEYFELSGEVTGCRIAERKAAEGGAPDTSKIDAQLKALETELQELQRRKAQYEQAETQRRRIAELEAQEKQLGTEYEELDRGVWLCDEFTKAKVRMLTERINGKLEKVRFRLFQEQLNGGVKDDCEVLVPSDNGAMVPYRDANNAARINAGLEIIEALSKHWDMEMPVFVDNAEGVQNIKAISSQLIQLIVPLTWDKLGEMIRNVLIQKYGSEEQARAAYEAPNKTIRLERE